MKPSGLHFKRQPAEEEQLNSSSKSKRKLPKQVKIGLIIVAICGGLLFTNSLKNKLEEIHRSLGHITDCHTFEVRKFIWHIQTLLKSNSHYLNEESTLYPIINQVDNWLSDVNTVLKDSEKESGHSGDSLLDYATETLEDWHYGVEGGDTVFTSEIMPDDPKATVSLWSTYMASLHGLNGWDFSIHVIYVTEKTVADVNDLIMKALPNEGQVLIDAISTPGFTADSFYLEGRRVDLTVYDWGIQFLFYLPTLENPLVEEVKE